MRYMLLLASFFISFSVLANCNVYIPEKEFNASGYPIMFDFTKMLEAKNYQEVYSSEQADLWLTIEGIEFEGPRFHRAQAIMKLGDYKVDESVLCLTQFCGVSDYGKAFNKAYKKLSALIPICR